MKVWQIGSGDGGRNFSSLCLKHDLMLLGPGNLGPFRPQVYREAVNRAELTTAKAGMIARFHSQVQPGELVLLRKGHRVVALGVISDEGYAWDDAFDDVRGWDLQHTRRVCWQDQLQEELTLRQHSAALFGERRMIPTFTRVDDERILAPVRDLFPRIELRPLRRRPEQPSEVLGDSDLARALFSTGLSNRATEEVISALNRQRRLQEWYAQHGGRSGRPTESEVVAHMVLPLLLALGWSEQLLAVEWNRVDLAGFTSAPTTSESCSLVCEAKTFGHGLSGVLRQAHRYVELLKLHRCNRILLTEGDRYYLYTRTEGGWSQEPSAYLNARKPRTRYLDGTSAVEALMALRQA